MYVHPTELLGTYMSNILQENEGEVKKKSKSFKQTMAV